MNWERIAIYPDDDDNDNDDDDDCDDDCDNTFPRFGSQHGF